MSKNTMSFENTVVKLTKSLHSPQLYYKNDMLGLYIGVWDNADMIETSVPNACDEFMTIIEGMVEIKNSQTGKMETVIAGESFVIPQGYDCQWYKHGYLQKFYVIYKPPIDPIPASPVCEHIIYIDDKSVLPWQKTSDGFHKKVQYQSHNQKFTAGVWQGENFKTGIINFPYNEFILVKQGYLVCTDDQGKNHIINTGEALFVPQGVCCAWQVQGKVSLHFVQIRP